MEEANTYEEQAARAFEAQLASGDLGMSPDCATIRRKPAYHSRDREKEIVFDFSIELRRRGGMDPYIVWIWECKNYSRKVPVDDVEEFHAKLNQVGADRTKGTMISPEGFDSGSLSFAKANGIGLWRFIGEGSPILLLEDRITLADQHVIDGLTVAETTGFRNVGFFYGLTTSGQFLNDRSALFATEVLTA